MPDPTRGGRRASDPAPSRARLFALLRAEALARRSRAESPPDPETAERLRAAAEASLVGPAPR
jgi:hypothetical protein